MDSTVLRQKADECLKKAEGLFKTSADENRPLNDDEKAQSAEFQAQAANYDKQANDLDAIQALRAGYRQVSTDLNIGATTDLRVTENFERDPKRGFSAPREMFASIIDGAKTGKLDPRLRSLAAGSDEHGIYSDPHGGFLIPDAFIVDLKTTPVEADPTIGRTMTVPMTAPRVKIPARVDKNHSSSVSGGLTVAWSGETAAISTSRLTMEVIALETNELVGGAYVTNELLNDSPISFSAILQRSFGEEFQSAKFNAKLNGTGVGQFLGVNNSPCLVTVAKESAQAADTINYTNLIKMRARCWGYQNAIWMANHDTIVQLMSLTDSAGNLIWTSSARDGEPDRIIGRPIVFSEYMGTVGDLGDIMVANWGEYLEGSRGGIQMAESIHVRFLNNENTFKFYQYVAGAPWWRSAMTQKNSTNTVSPFVNLAAR